MISAPETVWIVYNALCAVGTLSPKNKNRGISFGLALGTSALSCALLSSGLLSLFLGMEITLWIFASLIVLAWVAVQPPGADGTQAGRLALSSGFRLALALIVWLWI